VTTPSHHTALDDVAIADLSRHFRGALIRPGDAPYDAERRIWNGAIGDLRCIVLSKVGNFAIDLPDADVLIQVSGAFGSRQEEAQRLGRILRPKSDGRAARFFTLVSRDTREEEFAHHRKLFLTEQGYSYQVRVADRA
jgi:DNA excision repair protein ERCC-3